MATQDNSIKRAGEDGGSVWGSIFAYGLMIALAGLALVPLISAIPASMWPQLP